MKKTITTPIALLKVRGNHKEAAAQLNTTAICAYEPHIDTTYIVVKVEKGEGMDLKASELYRKALDLVENDFISRQYSESGIDFITK